MTAALALWLAGLSSTAAPQGSYFVRLSPEIADERVASTAHTLARTYDGTIRLINLRGFQVQMPDESARALAWDERVTMVASYPRALDSVPSSRFVGTASHGARDYRVMLADSGRRYDQVRVADIAVALASHYQGQAVGAFAPSVGRPWVILKARPPLARGLSQDRRVAWVAERSRAHADDSRYEAVLQPIARGPKRPASRAAKPPAPPRGALVRSDRHYLDWYFVALDPSRTDVSSGYAIGTIADEVVAAAGAERRGGGFVKPPQGFLVTATEGSALRIAHDPRVQWVEEASPLLRAANPIPGEYHVRLSEDAATKPEIEDELADHYGARITYSWPFIRSFAVAEMARESAVALSRDARVESVAENGLVEGTVGPPPVVAP